MKKTKFAEPKYSLPRVIYIDINIDSESPPSLVKKA